MKKLYEYVDRRMTTSYSLELRDHKKGAYIAVTYVATTAFLNTTVKTQSVVIPAENIDGLIHALTKLRDKQKGG